MRKETNPAEYIRYMCEVFEKLCERIDAQRENKKRIHLHVEYGRTEFDWVSQTMGTQDFCVGGIAYALINLIVSVNAQLHERCMCTVAPREASAQR